MISTADIKKLAELARIEITEKEAEALAKDVEGIVAYVKQVQEIPAQKSILGKRDIANVFREDKNPHETGAYTDILLFAVSEKENGFIRVKKIL